MSYTTPTTTPYTIVLFYCCTVVDDALLGTKWKFVDASSKFMV